MGVKEGLITYLPEKFLRHFFLYLYLYIINSYANLLGRHVLSIILNKPTEIIPTPFLPRFSFSVFPKDGMNYYRSSLYHREEVHKRSSATPPPKYTHSNRAEIRKNVIRCFIKTRVSILYAPHYRLIVRLRGKSTTGEIRLYGVSILAPHLVI